MRLRGSLTIATCDQPEAVCITVRIRSRLSEDTRFARHDRLSRSRIRRDFILSFLSCSSGGVDGVAQSLMLKRRWMRRTLAAVGLLAVLMLLVSLWAIVQLRSSLPRLQARSRLLSFLLPSTGRATHGVPTLTGRTRADLAWALGYLHAQERFFQMDGQRRLAAGELAELAGAAVLEARPGASPASLPRPCQSSTGRHDSGRTCRPGRLRWWDESGLERFGNAPFEYMLLRSTPAPWTAEDSVLTVTRCTSTCRRRWTTERRRARSRKP